MAETDLYPPLQRLFESEGYVAIPQFSFVHPLFKKAEKYSPKTDLAAFRWNDCDEVEAVAVEVKPGSHTTSPLQGIPQGVTYQLLFPLAYVAAETREEDLDFSRGVLEGLKLGYISVSANHAQIVLQPRPSERTMKSDFHEMTRPAGVLVLMAQTFLKDKLAEDFACNAKSESFWLWTRQKDRVQLQFGIGEEFTYFSCYSDIKWVCGAVATRAEPGRIAALLNEIPPQYETQHTCDHVERTNTRKLDYECTGSEYCRFRHNAQEIGTAMQHVTQWCQEPRRLGTLSFCVKLWKRDRRITRQEAEERVLGVLEPMLQLRKHLNSLL